MGDVNYLFSIELWLSRQEECSQCAGISLGDKGTAGAMPDFPSLRVQGYLSFGNWVGPGEAGLTCSCNRWGLNLCLLHAKSKCIPLGQERDKNIQPKRVKPGIYYTISVTNLPWA